MVGKRAEFAIEEMAEAQVLERYGPYYYIRPDIVDAIRKALYKQ